MRSSLVKICQKKLQLFKKRQEKGAKKPQIPNKNNEKLVYFSQKQRKCIKKYVSNAQSDHFLLSV